MTINKQALVNELMLQDIFANQSKTKVTEFVEDFFDLIANHVIAGNEVSIPGFGKFYKYTSTVDATKVTPKFKAFKDFKEAM